MNPISKKYLFAIIAVAFFVVFFICISFVNEDLSTTTKETSEACINLDEEIKKASDEAASLLNTNTYLVNQNNQALHRKDNLFLNTNTQSDEEFYKSYTLYRENNELLDRKSDLSNTKGTDNTDSDDNSSPLPYFVDDSQSIDDGYERGNKQNFASVRQDPKKQNELKSKRQDEFVRALNAKSAVYSSSVNFDKSKNENSNNSLDNNEDLLSKEYSRFKNDNYVLNNKVEKLKSPFALMQGSVLRARLINGINSELPGQITAQISNDVYDSIEGKYLLIPRGTKVIGMYSTNNNMNARRVFLGFSRLIFPNGSSLNLGAMPGQSMDGYAGLDADVQTHFFKNLISSFLISTISTTRDVEYSSSNYKSDSDYYAKQEKNNFLDNLADASNNTLSEHINLSPTLNVKPGFAFSIAITKDIYFNSPYRR